MTDWTKLYHSARRFAAGVKRRDVPSQAIADALKDGLMTTSSNNNEYIFSELLACLEGTEKKQSD